MVIENRTYEILLRTYEILSRTYEMLCRTYEILDRSAHAGLFFIYFFRVGAFFPLYLYASDCLNIQFTTFHKCYL